MLRKRVSPLNVSPLYAAACLLLLSGCAHGVVWLVAPSPWEGPLSWRKPILFGISTGLTAWSLAWVWLIVPKRRFDGLLVWLTAMTAIVEVGLITLQTWRGVPSHFNHSTLFDRSVHILMDVCIVALTMAIFDLTWRLLRLRDQADSLLIAYQQGMLMLSFSCVIGFVILGIGFWQQQRGLEPSAFGSAGVPKFAHGAVIHALQWLPAIALALKLGHVSQREQSLLLWSASWGSWGLLAYAMLQAFSGRSRFDATILSGNILGASAFLIGVPMLWAVIAIGRTWMSKFAWRTYS